MKKNHWIAEDDWGFANWNIKFLNTRMTNYQELWQYIKQLLIAAEENEIIRIIETSKFDERDRRYYFNTEESGESYVDFVDRILGGEEISQEPEKRRHLFWQLSSMSLRVLSKLCYYDLSGQVVEEDISYPAIAWDKTRPDLIDSGIPPKNAVEFHVSAGCETEMDNEELCSYQFIADGKKYDAAGLSIHVHSDIWFPLVLGKLDDEPAKEHYHLRDWEEKIIEHAGKKWFDNSELALRHTPRLNTFIQRAKQLTLEYGGTWEIDVGTLHSMWNEDGIVLDIDQILQWVRPPRSEEIGDRPTRGSSSDHLKYSPESE